jgi:hypothetical protein
MIVRRGGGCKKGLKPSGERKVNNHTREKWKYPFLTTIKSVDMTLKSSIKYELIALIPLIPSL